jgi:pilus assembly protein CpaE
MRDDKERTGLPVHLVGETELERAQVRQVLETLTEPRVELIEVVLGSTDYHSGDPAAALVINGANPALALDYLQHCSARSERPLLVALQSGENPSLMRQILHAGADELLPLPLDPDELALVFLKLKERRRASATGSKIGKIYSVAGLSGGVGMSTVSANLALAMRYELDRRVAIVDLDLQNGGIALKLHLAPEQTIVPLLECYKRLDSIKLEAALTKHSSGVYVLAAPKRIEDADLVSDLAVAAILELMRQLFDAVIVDCGRRINENAVAAWERSAEVLYVIDQSLWAARRMPRFAELFATLGLHDVYPRLVVNRFEPSAGAGITELADAAGAPIFATIPRDERAIERLQLHPEDLWHIAPSSRLARAFEKLARSVEAPTNDAVQALGLVARLMSTIGAWA